MGWGGRRPGAGRKPRKKSATVLGMDGQRRVTILPPALPSAPGEAVNPLCEPPTDLGLSKTALEVWRRLAPYAVEERTLISSRIPGFAKLCEEWAYCAAFEARLDEIGVTTAEGDRLLKRLNDYKKLLKASFGDYNLRSFGKPATADKPKKASPNAFAKLG